MDKMKFETVSLTERNIDRIAELFPNVVTEVKDADGTVRRAVDFDALKAELSDGAVEGRECYEFTWAGKTDAKIEAAKPIRKTLRPCKEESKNWDTTQNLYIEGDNLDVLKLLQESYLNKVKMIYIDPPYNTGNDFVYADDFRMKQDEYKELLHLTDENDNRMLPNTDSNGRFHSDWCSMMYSRLKLTRNLLTDDGVIFISIDDNEQASLKKICDEIFGAGNFIDTLIWKKRYGGGAKEKYFVSLHEYVLVYCKNIDLLNDIFVPLSPESADRYYSKRDEKYPIRGGYRTHPLEAGKAMDARPNLIYPIPAPDGTQIYPRRQWLWSKERAYEALANGDLEIAKGKDDQWVVSSKQYLREEDGNIRPAKMLSIIDDVYTQHGTNEMIKIMGNAKIFQYPKPSEFIKILVSAITEKGDEIILDFFSGSATTAHAVMQLNAEDGGNRKFIMVQVPEKCDEKSEAFEAGYKNICEIGKERIRRAGEKIKEEKGLTAQNLDIGFRVLKLDSSNMKDVYYTPAELTQDLLATTESNFKDDRTDLDLLYGCLLDWGLELSLPHETKQMDGFTVHYVNHTDLVACFDKNVSEKLIRAIAADKPLRVVFRDSCFKNISDKNNVKEIFKALSPDTTVKVI